MIDCYSRKLAGWAVADHMRTELVEDALKAACAQCGSLRGAIFHSDHGSVYTSKAYAKLCKGLGVTQSMGAVGTSADNSLAESFNATLKRELLAGQATFAGPQLCRRQVFRWVTRYNTRRRHSWCGYLSPNTYEARRASERSARPGRTPRPPQWSKTAQTGTHTPYGGSLSQSPAPSTPDAPR